mmetsp:Transcript_3205/g.8905  ORF Transcript_3205/g.8905 Transcript_3205/m.8905 type:complete len:221 (-) Transcript_3205:999-1661(-)
MPQLLHHSGSSPHVAPPLGGTSARPVLTRPASASAALVTPRGLSPSWPPASSPHLAAAAAAAAATAGTPGEGAYTPASVRTFSTIDPFPDEYSALLQVFDPTPLGRTNDGGGGGAPGLFAVFGGARAAGGCGGAYSTHSPENACSTSGVLPDASSGGGGDGGGGQASSPLELLPPIHEDGTPLAGAAAAAALASGAGGFSVADLLVIDNPSAAVSAAMFT